MQEFCYVKFPDGTAHTTAGSTLLEAASKALDWIEVDRQAFGTGRILQDSDVLEIHTGKGAHGQRYRVKVGRVREWRAARE
jgi:hypothetical protein